MGPAETSRLQQLVAGYNRLLSTVIRTWHGADRPFFPLCPQKPLPCTLLFAIRSPSPQVDLVLQGRGLDVEVEGSSPSFNVRNLPLETK